MTKTLRSTTAKLGLIAAIFASISGSAFAHDVPAQSQQAKDYMAVYSDSASPVSNAPDFNMSGTVGRLGLGANPAHPEGPGNFSN
jgi:hypothetical protein